MSGRAPHYIADTRTVAESTAQALLSPTWEQSARRAMYAGNATVQQNSAFLRTPTPSESQPSPAASLTRGSSAAARLRQATGKVTSYAPTVYERPATAAVSAASQVRGAPHPRPAPVIREGAHVGHHGGHNPLASAVLDPLAERALKIRDPVAHHVYRHPRPWVTQSSLIGEFLRQPADEQPPRLPSAKQPGSTVATTKRDVLRALKLASPRAIGDNAKPGDMNAVSSTRSGYVSPPPRAEGDMASTAACDFVDLRDLPEPATCKTKTFLDKAFYSKHPTNTAARDALATMWQPDGSLAPSKPEQVHAAVWRRVTRQERAAAALGNPHAHKRHAPGGSWVGLLKASAPVAVTAS